MANTSNSDKWYFTKEQLEGTPSRKAGFDALKELSYRQQAANFIQDMGQKLKVSQLCINTAIVYMHRFYVFHSFTNFPWHQMAAAALFLAAKVEEQPRKLEYVIRVANLCRNPRDTNFDINSERYISQSQDLVFNENVLLQTLGFDVAIDHPHTHVVRCCHLVRASKDLAQSSYFMASNSLHLTTMCLQYKPTVVACFCIMVACKWSNWEIPLSIERKEWFTYVDATVTAELLQQLTNEFLTIFENCPSRLKEKIMAFSDNNVHLTSNHTSSPFDQDPKKIKEDSKDYHRPSHDKLGSDDSHKHRSSHSGSGQSNREQRDREYKERKERERIASQKAHMGSSGKPVPHGHHKPPVDPKLKQPHSKPVYPQSSSRAEPRDILREASRDSPFGLAKDVSKQQRDYLLKPNVQNDTNYPDSRLGYDKRQLDPGRHVKKHESSRRYDDQKPYIKQETDNIKKHLSASLHEKTNAYLKSQNPDSSKSVPKPAVPPRTHHHNGSSNGSLPLLEDTKIKQEPVTVKEEIPTPAVIKRPSLFSPEQSPPHRKPIKTEVVTPPVSQSGLTPLSPILSPETKRTRNYSSSSEPELRPVMKKIDQVEGFENLMRDNTIGMGELHNEEQPPVKIKEEIKVEEKADLARSFEAVPESKCAIMNGLETNPTVISNLLKEAPTVPHLPTVAAQQAAAGSGLQAEGVPAEVKEAKDGRHKSKKKKEKHKHKDKDKSREDKEKRKKHKDKDREKHRHREKTSSQEKEAPTIVLEPHLSSSEPIKIKINIQKDKIKVPSPDLPPVSSSMGLKIKIPKDKIRTEAIGEPSQSPLRPPSGGSLKIKISKDVIANCTPPPGDPSSKKRERQSLPGDVTPPPAKLARQQKQNGRHHHYHHGKVAHSGDGDHSVHKLAESKYAKGSS